MGLRRPFWRSKSSEYESQAIILDRNRHFWPPGNSQTSGNPRFLFWGQNMLEQWKWFLDPQKHKSHQPNNTSIKSPPPCRFGWFWTPRGGEICSRQPLFGGSREGSKVGVLINQFSPTTFSPTTFNVDEIVRS